MAEENMFDSLTPEKAAEMSSGTLPHAVAKAVEDEGNIFDNLEKSMARGEPIAVDAEAVSPDEGGAFLGGVEAFGTVASASIAEPVAGLAGIGTGMLNLTAEGLRLAGFSDAADFVERDLSAGDMVEKVRSDLTFEPRTQEGKENVQSISEFVEPVASAIESVERGIGESVLDATDSPALAAAATTIPTLATEILGIGLGKGALRTSRSIKQSREDGLIARDLDDALPTREQLFDLGGKLYQEVDDAGASVKTRAYTNLVNNIEKKAVKNGLNKSLSPQAFTVISELRELSGIDIPLSEIDRLRKQAGAAAASVDRLDASLGVMMRQELDDFLDNANANTVDFRGGDPKVLGEKLKIARDLWGRARKSEIIEEAFFKADLARTGFENGLRQEFARLLRNKNTRKLFNEGEISAIKAVESGDSGGNIARLLGKFGFSVDKASNMTGGSIGTALGGAAGGPVSAVFIPYIGGVSRNVAERLTKNKALFADKVIRAGKDADKIVKAYNKFTPKADRSAAELSELLMRKDIDFSSLKGDKVAEEAARIAQDALAENVGAGAVTAAQGIKEIEEEQ